MTKDYDSCPFCGTTSKSPGQYNCGTSFDSDSPGNWDIKCDKKPKNQDFENWYQEIECFSLRAERLTSERKELEAAFLAGQRSQKEKDPEYLTAVEAMQKLQKWAGGEALAYAEQAKSLDRSKMYSQADKAWTKYWAYYTVQLWAEAELNKYFVENSRLL